MLQELEVVISMPQKLEDGELKPGERGVAKTLAQGLEVVIPMPQMLEVARPMPQMLEVALKWSYRCSRSPKWHD